MAYGVTGNTAPAHTSTMGRRGEAHTTYVVQETEIDPAVAADEFSIDVPLFITIVLLEAELSTTGSATDIRPEWGTTSQWTVDEIGDGTNATAIKPVSPMRSRTTWCHQASRCTPRRATSVVIRC